MIRTEAERLIVAEAIAHVLKNGGLFCWTRWTWIEVKP